MYVRNDNLTLLLKERWWDSQPHMRYREKKIFNPSERWLLLGYYKPSQSQYYNCNWFWVKHVSGLYSVVFADDNINLRMSVKSCDVKTAYKKLNRLVRIAYSRDSTDPGKSK